MDDVLTLPSSETEAAPNPPAWGRWTVRSVVLLGVLMCLYVGTGIWAARGRLLHADQQLPWQALPSILGLVLVGWCLRSLRWHYYVRRLGWPVPLGPSLLSFFASFAFTATPGKAGEVVKSVLLRTRYQVSLSEGAGVLLVERLGDLLAVLVLAAGGVALMSHGWIYFLGAALLVGGVTAAVSSRTLCHALLSRLMRIRKLNSIATKLLRLLDTGRALLRPLPLLAGFGIALVAWGCEGWALHVLLRSFGLELRPLTSCSVYGIATLVGALSALPGGVGSFEVVMVLLLSRLGCSVAAAALPVVLFRCCTLWLTSFLGLFFLTSWLAFGRRGRQTAA